MTGRAVARSGAASQWRRWGPRAALLTLVLLNSSATCINCDQAEASGSASSVAPSAAGGATPASAGPASDEYRQRPMPANRGAAEPVARINYDTQHESSSSTVWPESAAGSTSSPATTISVDSIALDSSTTVPSAETPPAVPSTTSPTTTTTQGSQYTTVQVDAISSAVQPADLMSVAESAPQVTVGELLAGGGQRATTGAESSGLAPAAGSSIGPDETTGEAGAAVGSTGEAGARHGRASAATAPQQQPGYSAPASSRLSAYSPGLLLQNSRSHSTIGATPLQFGPTPPASPPATTRRPPPSGPFDPIIVCYLGSWSTYRPSLAKFTPENINPFLCTHVIYAFAGLSSKFELKPFDSYNDITQGGYRKFTSLKEHNKQLKTLIAVGGWNEGSARFSKLVASAELRANFVSSTIRFLREHRFDGLDLDWEYPGYRDGSSPEDRERYALLIKELRAGFDQDKEQHPSSARLLLSIAVPAGQDNIDNGFDVPTISKNVDFMNVLTYDYYTAFDKTTNHHAPLSVRDSQAVDANTKRLNVDWTIEYYLSLGAPASKLIVGVPTYGRSYTLAAPLGEGPAQLTGREDAQQLADAVGLGAKADSPGEEGAATREKGYLAYYEICQRVDREGWRKASVAREHQGPVAYKANQWVSFDDLDSVVMKTEFVIRNRLGGVMIWTLDNDDFRASCPSSNRVENPLITAVRDTIIKAVTGQAPAKPTTTTTTTSTTTTTTTTTPAPASEPSADDSNELAASPSSESSERLSSSSSSLIRNLAQNAASGQAAVTTPDPGPNFACKDEGFFPNAKDCKKYFWCLDSGPANLGLVAHAFTCPSGLFFNQQTEGCDYPEKVTCKQARQPKPSATTSTTSTTTTTTTTARPAPPARDPQAQASSNDRSRLMIKKSRKPSSTTTLAPTTTTTTTPSPPTTTMAAPPIPITNDINELVASMLQNPQFANVISSQLKLSQSQRQQLSTGAQRNRPQAEVGDANSVGEPQSEGGATEATPAAPASDSDGSDSAASSKQAQDLLQLLNLIQQLGGVDKLTPSLMEQASRGNMSNLFADLEGGDNAAGLATNQRRPQPVDQGLGAEQANSGAGSTFVFNYNNNNNNQPAGFAPDDSSAAAAQGLSAEVMQNLAQLESLFAYNQPGRQQQQQQPPLEPLAAPFNPNAGPPPQTRNQLNNIESQPFTIEDAKPFNLQTSNRQQQQRPMIRVQVPQDQPQRGRQRQQQQQSATSGGQRANPNYNDIVNEFHLPYLEGDLRQPHGQRIQPLRPASEQRGRGNQAAGQAVASSTRQQVARPSQQQQPARPQQAAQQRQQQQQASAASRTGQSSQQQARRRPPNRERTQRLNSADFPAPSANLQDEVRPRSLVLLTSGPPNFSGEQQPQSAATAASRAASQLSDQESRESERALEERLRLLESGLISPVGFQFDAPSEHQQQPSPTTTTTTTTPTSSAGQSRARQPQQFGASSNSNGFFFQPTLSSLDASRPAAAETNFAPPGSEPSGAFSSGPRDAPADDAQPPGAAEPASEPSVAVAADPSGPGASLDSQTGKLVCHRRGVFAHPNSCGQFIVCAPQSRSHRSLRPFEHHCPAEHIFHDSWGRCRPKSLQSDLSKFCPNFN